MWMAAYDWRLPFEQLEARDQFFSRLRFHIEMFRRVPASKALGQKTQAWVPARTGRLIGLMLAEARGSLRHDLALPRAPESQWA